MEKFSLEFLFRIWNRKDSLNWYKHEKLAHYASDAFDIEYKYKMLGGDPKELEGIHARGIGIYLSIQNSQEKIFLILMK